MKNSTYILRVCTLSYATKIKVPRNEPSGPGIYRCGSDQVDIVSGNREGTGIDTETMNRQKIANVGWVRFLVNAKQTFLPADAVKWSTA